MSAYATSQRDSSDQLLSLGLSLISQGSDNLGAPERPANEVVSRWPIEASRLACSTVSLNVLRPRSPHDFVPRADRQNEWFDSRQAAEYLGLHRDSLRRLAAERTIPAEQDGPGCKLYFRRVALDDWRRAGGRAGHLAILADAA